MGAAKAEPLPAEQEKEHPHHGGNRVTRNSAQGSAQYAHLHRPHIEIVQHRIGDARRHRQTQAQSWPPGGDKKALKEELEHGHGCKAELHPQIGDRIVQQQIAGPQQPGQRPGEENPRQADRQADAHRHQGQKAEVPPGLLQISGPHLVGHHGGTAGAQHDPHGQGKADGRIGHIGGGQGVLSHQAGNQHPVHDGVEADHQHHDNGGQGKAQQPRQVEVAVQAVGHG